MIKLIEKNVFFENDLIVDRAFLSKTVKRTCIPFMRPLEVCRFISAIFAAAFVITYVFTGFNKVNGNDLDLGWFCWLMFMWVIIRIRSLPEFRAKYQYKAFGGRDVCWHYVFDDDGIQMCADNGMADSYTYYNMNSITDDGDDFVLRVKSTSVIRIPKNSFTYGDPGTFFAFITERTAKSVRAKNAVIVAFMIVNILLSAGRIVSSVVLILANIAPVVTVVAI